ncbi:MAG: hypothetical protein ACK40H_03705, partial [Sphingomonadaceae bacterium]
MRTAGEGTAPDAAAGLGRGLRTTGCPPSPDRCRPRAVSAHRRLLAAGLAGLALALAGCRTGAPPAP